MLARIRALQDIVQVVYKMDTITIKILKNGFSYSYGSGPPRIRNSSSVIFNWVERKLQCLGHSLASQKEVKTSIKVFYLDGCLNEATTSNYKELLFALAAFLEDYLPKGFLSAKYKKYGYSGKIS